MMRIDTLMLALGAVLFSGAGQLLLKTGTRQLAGQGQVGFLFAAFRNPHVVSGLIAWAVSTICWLYVLRAAPLSRAYGLTSLTYVLVLLGSIHLFGEQVRRIHIAGTILIVVGIACLLQAE